MTDSVIAGNVFQTSGYTYGGGAYLNAGSTLTLTRSRVEHHSAPSVLDGRGAGLYIYDSTVTLDDSDVTHNAAGAVGGGIRMFGTSTLLIQGGSSVSDNTSLNSVGGAIAAAGLPDIDITGAILHNNTAAIDGGAIFLEAGTLDLNGWWDLRYNQAGGYGGALAVMGTGDLDLAATTGDSFLAHNTAASHGGAIYVGNADTVTLHANSDIARIHLDHNTAGGDGGAAYASNGAYFDLYGNLQAASNIAAGLGGAFYLSGGSRIWLDDYLNIVPHLWDNHAQQGGAIYALASPHVKCDGAVFGDDLNGNQATAGSGGAIYLQDSTFSAENCTFQSNQATLHGGAIAASGSTLTINANLIVPASLSTERSITPEDSTSLYPAATGCDPLSGPCSSLHHNSADSDENGSGDGGAIYLNNSALQVDQTFFNGNSANRGGGVYQDGAASVAECATA
jgi:predicted outer membrane repeat protein